MPYAIDAHDANLVRDFINHSVVTHANAPVVLAAREFAAARRTWICGKCLNRCDDAVVNLGSESSEVFLRTAFKQDATSSLALSLWLARESRHRHDSLVPDNPISHVMAGAAQFRTTRWSMVMRAGAEQLSEADERRALEELCRAYWYPVYSFVRRRGVDAHEAQDLTQAFFEKLIARNAFAVADQERGRFRTFLLAALNNFLFTERERAHRQKRGGGCEFISLDAEQAENRFQHEPATKESADRVFARRWIETLLVCVLERLAAEARDAGQGERFEQLKCYLVDDGGAMSFAALAAQLGTTEAAAKGVVRRMRARYRELVHEEVAHTVGSPDQIDEEIRHLMAAFG